MKILEINNLISIDDIIKEYKENNYIYLIMNKELIDLYFKKVMKWAFNVNRDAIGIYCKLKNYKIEPTNYLVENPILKKEIKCLYVKDLIYKNNTFYFKI